MDSVDGLGDGLGSIGTTGGVGAGTYISSKSINNLFIMVPSIFYRVGGRQI